MNAWDQNYIVTVWFIEIPHFFGKVYWLLNEVFTSFAFPSTAVMSDTATNCRVLRGSVVPLEFQSLHMRSAPSESDTDAPPSAAPSQTPLGLLSPSLKPDVEVKQAAKKTHKMHVQIFFETDQHFHVSYLLDQTVDFKLLLPFVHLLFLFGKFQLKLHLLFVFPLLLQRVCVGHFLLFLLLLSFLRCHQSVQVKKKIITPIKTAQNDTGKFQDQHHNNSKKKKTVHYANTTILSKKCKETFASTSQHTHSCKYLP